MVDKFEPDHEEVGKLLRSSEVLKMLQQAADKVARAAGPGHKTDVYQGFDRARAMIWTASGAARKGEAENRTLTRAIDAGRL